MILGISTLLSNALLGNVDIEAVLLTVIKQVWVAMPLSRLSTVKTIEVQPRVITRSGMAATIMMLSRTDQRF